MRKIVLAIRTTILKVTGNATFVFYSVYHYERQNTFDTYIIKNINING